MTVGLTLPLISLFIAQLDKQISDIFFENIFYLFIKGFSPYGSLGTAEGRSCSIDRGKHFKEVFVRDFYIEKPGNFSQLGKMLLFGSTASGRADKLFKT